MTLIRSLLGIPDQASGSSRNNSSRKNVRSDRFPSVVIDADAYLERLTQYAIESLEYRLRFAYPVHIQPIQREEPGDDRITFDITIPYDKPVRRALDLTTYVSQAGTEESSGSSTFYLFQCTVLTQEMIATAETSVRVTAAIYGPVLKIEFAKGQIVYGNPEVGSLTFLSPFNPVVTTIRTQTLIDVTTSAEATTYITLH